MGQEAAEAALRAGLGQFPHFLPLLRDLDAPLRRDRHQGPDRHWPLEERAVGRSLRPRGDRRGRQQGGTAADADNVPTRDRFGGESVEFGRKSRIPVPERAEIIHAFSLMRDDPFQGDVKFLRRLDGALRPELEIGAFSMS